MSQTSNLSAGLDDESRELLAKGLSTAAVTQSIGMVSADPELTKTRMREQAQLNDDMVELNKELQQKRAALVAGQGQGAPGTAGAQRPFTGRKRRGKQAQMPEVANVNAPATVNIPAQPEQAPIAPVNPLPPNLTAADMELIENVKKSRMRSRENFFAQHDSVHPGAVDARPEYANDTYRNPIKMLNGERDEQVAKFTPPPELPSPPERPTEEQMMSAMEQAAMQQFAQAPATSVSRPQSPSLESLGLDAVNYHTMLQERAKVAPPVAPQAAAPVPPVQPQFTRADSSWDEVNRVSQMYAQQTKPANPVPTEPTPAPAFAPTEQSWENVEEQARRAEWMEKQRIRKATAMQPVPEPPPVVEQPSFARAPFRGEPQLPPFAQPQVRQTPVVRPPVADPSRPNRDYGEFGLISGWPSRSVFYPNKIYGQSLFTVDAIQLGLAEDDEISDIVDDVLSRRIKGIDPGDILTADEEYLMYWLRASSYPSQAGHGLPKVKFKCPHCKQQFNDAQSLSMIQPITFMDLDFKLDSDPLEVAAKHSRNGYAVFTAYDGREVHVYLRRRKHDAVIREYEEKWEEITHTYLPKHRAVELAAAAVIEIEDCKDMNAKLEYIENYPLEERIEFFQAIGDAQVVSHTVANIRCPFCGGTASVPYPFHYRRFVASL